KGVDTPEKLQAFIDNDLDFSILQTYGGHSPCVELDTATGEFLCCDMGSGARAFGTHVMNRSSGKAPVVNIVMSHVHWDHIMGFPFFTPAYVPGARLRIYGCHDVLEHAFRLQQSAPCFPVAFDRLGSDIEFVRLEPAQ